jgi:hypothetical protein
MNYDDFKIIKNKKTPYKFIIDFQFNYKPIIESFTKTSILKNVTVTNEYTFLSLNAKNFDRMIDKKLSYQQILKLVLDFCSQLEYLMDNYHLILSNLNIQNFFMIDSDKFIYIPDLEQISKIERDNQIRITYPFSQNSIIMNPELKEITSIPTKIHMKSSYFSFGILILYLIHDHKIDMKDCLDNYKTLLEESYIFETSLYYFLLRCLKKSPYERRLIYI